MSKANKNLLNAANINRFDPIKSQSYFKIINKNLTTKLDCFN